MAIAITISHTVTLPLHGSVTPMRISAGTVAAGNPYAAGGVAILATDIGTAAALAGVGGSTIHQIIVNSSSLDGQASYVWDAGNAKLLGYDEATNAEFGAVDLSGAGKVAPALFIWN
jgi:hypothetical protein